MNKEEMNKEEMIDTPNLSNEKVVNMIRHSKKQLEKIPKEQWNTSEDMKHKRDAEEMLLKNNYGLIHSIVKMYRERAKIADLEYMDLFTWGCIGLYKAIDKYDPERGALFSTFATPCIKRSIYDGILAEAPLDNKMVKKIWDMKRIYAIILKKYGRAPSDEEYMEQLKWSRETLEDVKIHISTIVLSADAPVGEDEDSGTILDTFLSDSTESLEDQVIGNSNASEFLEIMTQAEQNMLMAFEGMDDKKYAYDFIAEHERVTPERIRQIVEKLKNRIYWMGNIGKDDEEPKKSLDTKVIKNGIGTSGTEQALENIKKWSDLSDNEGRHGWEQFMQQNGTVDLVKFMRFPNFYEYFASYLIYTNKKISDDLAEMYKLNPEDLDTIRKKVCELIEEYNTVGTLPYPDAAIYFADHLAECFKDRGYYKKGSCEELRSSICPVGYKWNREELLRLVVKESISEDDFFNLAVGMGMDVEDAREFLQKVLLRADFNPFVRKELIVYLCLILGQSKVSMSSFVTNLDKKYKDAVEEHDSARMEVAGTVNYRKWINQQIEDNIFNDNDDWLLSLFSEIKYEVKQNTHKRTANQKFLELYDELKELCQKDMTEWIAPKGDFIGNMIVEYRLGEELRIPDGFCFSIPEPDKTNRKDYHVCRGCGVNIPASDIVPVNFEVRCTGKPAENGFGTLFADSVKEIKPCKAPYLSNIRIDGEFEERVVPGFGRCAVGRMLADCDLKQVGDLCDVMSEGTKFEAGGYQFESLGDMNLRIQTIAIPVYGRKAAEPGEPHAEENMLGEIMDGSEKKKKRSEWKSVIRVKSGVITNSKVNRHGLVGVLDQYLYNRANGNIVYGLDESGIVLDDMTVLNKLVRILEGTDIDFNNLVNRLKNVYRVDGAIVSRMDLMTVAFLVEMAKVQFINRSKRVADRETYAKGVVDRVNAILNTSGYYGIYVMNPYDALLLYITCFEEEPLNVFRNLWGIVQDRELLRRLE